MEALGLVPSKVRDYVLERDQGACRVCGRFLEHPALHHVVFRSQGGPDLPSNLISIGWGPGHMCHLTVAHGDQARYWRKIFLAIVERPELTALQVHRRLAVRSDYPPLH